MLWVGAPLIDHCWQQPVRLVELRPLVLPDYYYPKVTIAKSSFGIL